MHAALARELDDTLTFAGLRDALGETDDGLQQFVDAGVIKPNLDGRFAIEQSVADYRAYWQAIVASRSLRA
jgi:hypothetical protein